MKKNMFFAGILVFALGLVLVACVSAPKVDLTGVTTYYVRADGNDGNSGISEDAPFKSLKWAVQAASTTAVKKITVIGTLPMDGDIADTDPTPKQIAGQLVPGSENEFADGKLTVRAYAVIDGSYDDPDSEEILITGKSGVTGAERAVLQAHEKTIRIHNSTVRFENIEICGFSGSHFLAVVNGVLIFAKGTAVTNNSSATSVIANRGILIMRDDASIFGNTGRGVILDNGSVLVMRDHASITNNKDTGDNGGGGIAMVGSTTYLLGNAKISDNSAGIRGGGIITFRDEENGFTPQITMRDNSSITGNTAKGGGGIFLNYGSVDMEDNSQITGNIASEVCGGVYVMPDTPYTAVRVYYPYDGKLKGNTAPQIPDANEITMGVSHK